MIRNNIMSGLLTLLSVKECRCKHRKHRLWRKKSLTNCKSRWKLSEATKSQTTWGLKTFNEWYKKRDVRVDNASL